MQLTPPVVAVRDLRVSLGGTEVVASVSGRIDAGQAVALMGANGSGKTTLVRALLGLIPHRGEISLFGTPHHGFRNWSQVGYVPQRPAPSLQGATVREVVTAGRLARRRLFLPAGTQDRRIVQECIDRVGLGDRAQMELGELSGGQQQRTLIARALAGEPRLMVLDEPMAGIDLPTQAELAEVLAGLKADGMAMLVVLHDLGPMDRVMDRAWVLRDGRLIHDGAPRASLHQHHDPHCADPSDGLDRSLVEGAIDREWRQ